MSSFSYWGGKPDPREIAALRRYRNTHPRSNIDPGFQAPRGVAGMLAGAKRRQTSAPELRSENAGQRNLVGQRGISPINRTMPAKVLHSTAPGDRGAGQYVKTRDGVSHQLQQGYGFSAKPRPSYMPASFRGQNVYVDPADFVARAGVPTTNVVPASKGAADIGGETANPSGGLNLASPSYPQGYDVGGQTVTQQQGVNPGALAQYVPGGNPTPNIHLPMQAAGGFQHPLAAALPLIRNLIANALASQRPASWPSNQ